MKKLLAILIAGMMLLSLAACNGANGAGIDLKYDFTHMNDKNYHAHINLAAMTR